MTKKNKKLSYSQPSLFDYIRQSANPSPGKGSLFIEKEFKAALSDDLAHACDELGREISRAQVAARMTDYLGEEVSLSTLNNWTAASHPHSMPASQLPAFVKATGGQRRAVEVLSRHSGLFMLPGPDALRAEIQRKDETVRKEQSEIRILRYQLKTVEGG